MATIHLLKSSGKAGNKLEIVAKCGYVAERRSNDPFPVEITGWQSKVTCAGCLF
jgi:hypothetical protein